MGVASRTRRIGTLATGLVAIGVVIVSSVVLTVLSAWFAPGSAEAWAVYNETEEPIQARIVVAGTSCGHWDGNLLEGLEGVTIDPGENEGVHWSETDCNPSGLRDASLVIQLFMYREGHGSFEDGEGAFMCGMNMKAGGFIIVRNQARADFVKDPNTGQYSDIAPNTHCLSLFEEVDGNPDTTVLVDYSDYFAGPRSLGAGGDLSFNPPLMLPVNRFVRFLVTGDPQYHFTGLDSDDNHFESGTRDADRVLARANQQIATNKELRGLLIAGDLTQTARLEEINHYKDSLGGFWHRVFEGMGNHDVQNVFDRDLCDDLLWPCSYTERIRDYVGEKSRNTRQTDKTTPHYSWDWHDVHFVQLNLWPGNEPTAGRVEECEGGTPGLDTKFTCLLDPMNALDFLERDLSDNVGDSGRPVVLTHHYGFDCFSTGTCGKEGIWWTEGERAAYWNAIEDYNIIAIFTGHAHKTTSSAGWRQDFHMPAGSGALPDGRESIPTFTAAAAKGAIPPKEVSSTPETTNDGVFLDVEIDKCNQLSVTRRDELGHALPDKETVSFSTNGWGDVSLDCFDDVFPAVEITTPAQGVTYPQFSLVQADYSCDDNGGPGVAFCVGDLVSGDFIDTTTLGSYAFTVTATDVANKRTIDTHSYFVGPPNDYFADASVLTGVSVSETGTNAFASQEPGESNHAGDAGGSSVWYQWTPASAGQVLVHTHGSDFNTLLGVYTGPSIGSLVEVASNDDWLACTEPSCQTSQVSFFASGGTTYYLAVDGLVSSLGPAQDSVSEEGLIRLNIEQDRSADIEVLMIGEVISAVPGAFVDSAISYTITVTNLGLSDDPQVEVYDEFPIDYWFCSWTSEAAGGATGNSGGFFEFELEQTLSMPANSSVVYTIDCLLQPWASGTHANTVTTTGSFDPTPDNNSATHEISGLTPVADLTLTVDGPDSVVAGEELTYTLTVDNVGPSSAVVTFVDALGSGVTYVSDTQVCVEEPTGTVTCYLGFVHPDAPVSFDITVRVDADTPAGTITNTATVSSGAADPDTSNNTATEDITVTTEADLSITKTDFPDPVTAGETVTYTVTVDNAGPSDATGVTVTDTLPTEVSYVSDTDTCAESPTGTLTCDLGTIASGSSSSFDITVAVNSATPAGTISNSATVSSDVTDPDTSNNTATEDTTVTTAPDTAAPTVTIITPLNGASFTVGDSVVAAYSCADEVGGSGLASCVGTVANGAAIDTATAGAKTFSVTGTDNAGNTTTVTHNYGVTAVLPKVIEPDTVGVVNIDNAQWYLANSAGAITNFEYGNPVDLPISGNWDGPANATSTPGLFRQGDGFLYARNSNSTGIAHFECFAGDPSDVPLSGDWDGDGDDNLGIMRLVNNQPTFYLYTTTCNNAPMGGAQISFEFGDAGDTPVVGDWDGDGKDEIGLYRRSNGFFYNRDTLSTGGAHNACFAGDASDFPVGGDWDGDGDGNFGIFRPADQKFFLFTKSCVGLAPPATPFANALGAAEIEVPLPVTTDATYLASLIANDKLKAVSGAFGLG